MPNPNKNKVALITAARRSPISPEHGALKNLEIEELCNPVIDAVIRDAQISKSEIDYIVLGNALGAGGNPARLCTLSAGISDSCPAMTVDTQCCSGMDAIGIAATKIKSGQANVILAGGVESFSRAPLRARLNKKNKYVPYTQAKFSPFHLPNSDIFSQMDHILRDKSVSFKEQCQLAIESHRKAKEWNHPDIVPFDFENISVYSDTFTRSLNYKTCVKANGKKNNLNPCLIANRADGSAFSVLMSKEYFNKKKINSFALKIKSWQQFGYDPRFPANIPKNVFGKTFPENCHFDQIEWMESFASQYLLNKNTFNLPHTTTNPYGGMIAMGHPIAASGAILIGRLYQGLKITSAKKKSLNGLAVIPSAGGLVSAIKVSSFTL